MFSEFLTNTYYRIRLTAKLRIQFYRALQTLQGSNVQIEVALLRIRDIYSKNGRAPRNILALMASDGAHGCGSGQFIHQALSDWLPPDELSILASGVPTGRMDDAYQKAIKVAKSKQTLLRGVISELMQPFILCLVAAGVLFNIAVDVIPDFLNNRDPGEPLTGTGALLDTMSYVVANFWWAFIGLALLLCGLVYWSFGRWTGRLRVFFDRLPPWSIYKEIHGCVFLMNVAVLQGSGLIVLDALREMRGHSTPWLRERIDLTLIGLAQGQDLGEALENAECAFPSAKALPFIRVLAAQDGAEEHMAAFADERLADSLDDIKASCGVMSLFILILITILAGTITAGLNSLSAV